MTRLERILIRTAPVSLLIRSSKQCGMPGSRELSVYDVLLPFLKQIKKVGLVERASAISFNLIMALPAAVLFLFALIPYFPASWGLKRQIFGLIKDIAPTSDTYTLLSGILNDLFRQHVGVFSFGFLLLIFYASNAMIGVIRTFDKSIQEHKGFFLHQRWRAIKLTSILIILVIAAVLVLLGQQQLRMFFGIPRRANHAWLNALRWSVIIGLLFYSIALVYTFAPSVTKRWKLISPGSVLATSLMLLTAMLFTYWINHFAQFNQVYGSIGTVLIIMLLIYINSLILLIGFELNVTITYLRKEKLLAVSC